MTIIAMIEQELSEPYPIYTYRYFVQKWPELTLLAYFEDDPDKKTIGCIVSKLEENPKHYDNSSRLRGYIAMLAVDPNIRRIGLGRKLVHQNIEDMKKLGAEEIMLETEITNSAALRLYESFGFLKEKRLQSYYLNNNDAYKLKLFIK
jgi:peptide alpha-N-acetyltransferase